MTFLRELAVASLAGATVGYLTARQIILCFVAVPIVIVYIGGYWHSVLQERRRGR